MPRVYHLGVSEREIAGAPLALLPGDPARVEKIAATRPIENGRFVASHREFCTWLGSIGDTPVVITSTGIGGPSTAIVVEELAQLGVKIFIRVGTSGAIQPYLNIGRRGHHDRGSAARWGFLALCAHRVPRCR
jgi:uridine phosphorylase